MKHLQLSYRSRKKRQLFIKKTVAAVSAVILIAVGLIITFIMGQTTDEAEDSVEAMNRNFIMEEDNTQNTEDRIRVCIDAGHGGSDCGAEYQGSYEKDQVLAIAKLVQQQLQSSGIEVVMTRSTDVFLGLDERTEICNNASCDLLVSIHRNFYVGDTSVRGFEAWIHSSKPQDAYELADYIMKELSGIEGVKDRGIKTGSMTDSEEDYRVNRDSKCTSCLLELGFMSNSIDTELVTVNKEEVAKAIADGIRSYLDTVTVKK
ncbi:MAG: N-acetylmuramoyl-L-alanine amidase [Lachnospira sp.]|nr:N-acetylmuramoyl-L-alanine amidase [Lachnospira sp.]